MKKYKYFLSLFLFSACFLAGTAQENNDKTKILAGKLDEYLSSLANAYRFNGDVLIAQKGEIILNKGYGYKNVAANEKNDGKGIFQIGSVTKSFTAEVVLKLQEEGKLSVSDKLSKYLPGYPHANDITIENLLTHTSGIAGYDVEETDTIAWTPVSRDVVTNIFKDKPLAFIPGTKYSYSNAGYFLLGMIVEKVTGKSYEQVIREKIFEPLQMSNSGFDFIHLHNTLKATGYGELSKDKQRPAHLIDSTVSYAAGAIYSSVDDMYKWVRSIAGHKILSAGMWKKALTPYRSNYGYGFIIDSLNGKNYIGHSGGIMGFTSYVIYFPEEDVTIILLNNYFNESDPVMLPVQDISAVIFNKPYTLYKDIKEVKLSDSTLGSYVGTYALSSAPGRQVIITKEHDILKADLQGKITTPVIFETDTEFSFKGISNVKGKFIIENSKVVKMIIDQNGKYEWNKIK